MMPDSPKRIQILQKILHTPVFLVSIAYVFLTLTCLSAQVLPLRNTNKDTTASDRTLFIQAARSYLGSPYLSGGISKKGMDCSGLVYRAALDALEQQVPRTVASLSADAQKVSDAAREPGDLLFFNTTGRVSHVGIYLGSGTFVHAASDGPRTGVIISDLSEEYWKKTYMYTGRIFRQEGIKIPDSPSITAPAANPFPFGGEIGLRMNYTGGILWDVMPLPGGSPIRGGSLKAEVTWVKNLPVYPGIGAGFAFDTKTGSASFPVFASLTSVQGFRFFIGTQIHLIADPALNREIQFPGIIGVSWNSKPANLLGQKVRFFQSVEYSWFPNETFGTGLRFNTGLTISCDI